MLIAPIYRQGNQGQKGLPRGKPDSEAGGAWAAHLCPKVTTPGSTPSCPSALPACPLCLRPRILLVNWPEAQAEILWGNNSISMWVQTQPVLPLSV